jgi:hypothetical protein
MALETATYIADLNPTNPPGTDPVAQADDHLRLIKQVLQNTFPNQTGPFVGVDGIDTTGVTSTILTLRETDKVGFGTTLSNDGFPDSRYILDTTNGDYDWYLSRGIYWDGADWLLSRAGHSPGGLFVNGDSVTTGRVTLAVSNHNSLPVGSDMGRPEDWPTAIELVSGSLPKVRLNIGGSTYFSVDANESIWSGLMRGTTLRADEVQFDGGDYGIRWNRGLSVGTDQRVWDIKTNSTALDFSIWDDALVNQYVWQKLTRSGTGAGVQVDTIDFTAATSISLGNFAFNPVQAVGAGQDNFVLTYDNGTGLISLESAAGGGNVSNSGTPVNNQVAVWTTATNIEGDANLTFDGAATTGNQLALGAASTLTLGNAMSISGFPAGFVGDALDVNVGAGTGNGIRVTHTSGGVTSGITVSANSVANLAATFYSNTASRTQPVVQIHNDNPTGSGKALEIIQDQSAPHITLAGTNGEGIKFPSSAQISTDANTLDDYQEGVYTATLTPRTSGSITLDSANNSLSYTKIGREVHVQGFLNVSSVSSPVGIIELNLPFSVDPQTEGRENSGCTIAAFGLTTGTLPAHASVIGFTHGGFNVLRIFVASLGSATLVDFGDHCSSSTDIYLDFNYISDE